MDSFRRELEELINKHSLENGSDTPDFMLAEYLVECLRVFDRTTNKRRSWYGEKIHVEPDYEQMAADMNYHNLCARATLFPGKEINEIPRVTADELRANACKKEINKLP